MHTNISPTPLCILKRPSFPKKSGEKITRKVHTLRHLHRCLLILKRISLNIHKNIVKDIPYKGPPSEKFKPGQQHGSIHPSFKSTLAY